MIFYLSSYSPLISSFHPPGSQKPGLTEKQRRPDCQRLQRTELDQAETRSLSNRAVLTSVNAGRLLVVSDGLSLSGDLDSPRCGLSRVLITQNLPRRAAV